VIERVEALKYKSLRYVNQQLRPFQVLIGPNASGKSAFLDTVDFLGDLIEEGADYAVRSRATSVRELVWQREGEQFELAVELRFPQELRERLASAGRPYARCRYEVAIGVDLTRGGIQTVGENFLLLPERRDAGRAQALLFPVEPEPPDSILLAKHAHVRAGSKRVVRLAEEGKAYFWSELTGWNFPLRPGGDKPALAQVPEDEGLFPVSNWARRLLAEGAQVLALNSAEMRHPCSPLAPHTFQPDGSNLPVVVRRLQEESPHKHQAWVKHLRAVLPDLEAVEVRERLEDRHLYLVATYSSGLKVPSWLISDGTLRLLALTLLAYITPGGRVYLIEEPENGIHPSAVEAVFQSLSSVYGDQVLIATHSPVMLGLADPQQILCFARTASGSTDIVTGSEHPALAGWRGEVNLGVLYASGLLG